MRTQSYTSTGGRGPAGRLWPLLVLLTAVVVAPTVCVLWLMSAAVRNERIAVRQKLLDDYTPRLDAVARQVNRHWEQKAERLSAVSSGLAPAELFARLVSDTECDSAVVYDESGGLAYPVSGPPEAPLLTPVGGDWGAAAQLEFRESDYAGAAALYRRIAEQAGVPDVAGRALQALARCLAKAGQREEAVEVLAERLAASEYAGARDPRGGLLAPNGLLMALELVEDDGPRRAALVERLVARLKDYAPPLLTSSQRRFLMARLQEVAPGSAPADLLQAEELAATYVEMHPVPRAPPGISPSGLDRIWQLSAPDGTGVALLTTERIAGEIQATITAERALSGASVEVVAPGEDPGEPEPFIVTSAGELLYDWRLVLRLKGPDPFAAATRSQVSLYMWTGFLVMAFTAAIALVVGRYLLREMKLARLRNDFIATVSHELKTPLASMRVLVDTLVAGHYRDQQQVTDYLRLIASENRRLSRLIDNFLGFSRMERDKRAFGFAELRPAEIVAAAEEAVRSKFEAGGCRFDVDVAPNLPIVTGDHDALVTVLLNLLDNAYKYSDNDKRIALRTYAADGEVCFEVEDNGVGLPTRAVKKVFDRFYQVDRSLSRSAEGCGLGLSIVKFIVGAHNGSIDVKSQLGEGSTFTVRLPATGGTAPN